MDEFGAPRYPELVLATARNGAPADGELTCGLLEGINPAYRDISDDPQAVIEEMLGEVEGLDADSQRAQFAELVAADAFSQLDDGDPDPALSVRAVSDWAVWAASAGY